MDGYLEKPLDNKEQSLSNEELMIRRLKNRERQRRYRARKRLQADMHKASDSDVNQHTLQHVQLPEDNVMPLSITNFPANQCSPVLREVPVTATQAYEMPFNSVAQENLKPANGTYQEPVTRVYCPRDWKRDARKARLLKQQEATPSNGSQTSLTHIDEPDMVRSIKLPLGVSAQVSSEAPRFIASRRHWKAEARNKRS